MQNHSSLSGCLLGTAVADALGLPAEGLSPRRQARLFANLERYHLLPGLGFCSDDTEHTCMSAAALVRSGGEPRAFARNLAWRLRFWLLGLPAGVGLATGRAIIKLWLGFPPHLSGVFSAGNGPAMRAPLLGAMYGHDSTHLTALVAASTRLTHRDPKAYRGALAAALAAHLSHGIPGDEPVETTGARFLEQLGTLLGDDNDPGFTALLAGAVASAAAGESAADYARRMGLEKGVGGYIYHTMPVVIQVWLGNRHDFHRGVQEIIRLGGDTDTTAAILGGILGAGLGREAIPPAWLAGLAEWPRTVAWMDRLALALASGAPQRLPSLNLPGLLLRNVLFFVVVLLHGMRRLLPPY